MATPAHDQANVRSVKEFLQETLAESDRADRAYHQARRRLRLRLHALELADDERTTAEIDALADNIDAGREPATFSLDEVREREAQR